MPAETPHPLWYRKRPWEPPSARNPTTDTAVKIGSPVIPAKIFWNNISSEEDLNQSYPIRDFGRL